MIRLRIGSDSPRSSRDWPRQPGHLKSNWRLMPLLTEAGQLLGITALDHLVITRTRYYSMADSRSYPIAPGEDNK